MTEPTTYTGLYPAPFTANITEDLLDLAWKSRGARRPIVLLLVHHADWQIMLDYTAKYKTDDKFVPGTLMGIPVWKGVQYIERGTARIYYSWASAYENLKNILTAKDVEKLRKRMEAEREK